MADVKPVKSGWFNLFRPWTLHGAVVPVLIGGAVAWHDGIMVWWVFVLVLICGCLLQSVANILNTYGDFVKGTDTLENHSRSPELVDGTLTPKKALMAGVACMGVVAVCGLLFIWHMPDWNARIGMVLFGIAGLGGAAMYTVGASYKYLGLGQVGVFILMGILMPIGTYYTMAGTFSWAPILIGLPNAFTITAVLAGNETRDYHEDRKSNVGTLSGRMSYESAMKLYLLENILAPVLLVVLVILGVAPWPCLIALVCLYDLWLLIENSKKAPTDPGCSRLLVPKAFTFNWHFGAVLVLGYVIANLVL